MGKHAKLVRATLGSLFCLCLAGQAAPDLAISQIEVEEGTYIGGDPIRMSLTVINIPPANPSNDPADDTAASYRVDVFISEETTFRTLRGIAGQGAPDGPADDHQLTILGSGGLGPGDSHTFEWHQMAPGNLVGTFFVNAVVTITGGPGDRNDGNNVYGDAVNQITTPITLAPTNFPTTNLLSVRDEGREHSDPGLTSSDGISQRPSISRDGRFVAFESIATNLISSVVDDGVSVVQNDATDIYVRDQQTGAIERVSVSSSGIEGNAGSYNPQISADSRYVAFHSFANNLVPADSNLVSDVFLRDRETGTTERVSLTHEGTQATGPSMNASVSEGGRYVVFESEAANLVPGDTNGVADIFLIDRNRSPGQAGYIRRVSVRSDGTQALGGDSRHPRISADGRHVVFQSRATNLVEGITNTVWDIYVHDRNANETYDAQGNPIFDEPGGTRTRRVSVAFDGDGNPLEANNHSTEADISEDGRFIAFTSTATNLFSNPATGMIDLSGRAARGSVTFMENEGAVGIVNFAEDINATGTISLLEQPEFETGVRKTIEISDGVETVVFELAAPPPFFNPEPGNVSVLIAAQRSGTLNNLRRAIQNSTLTLEAVAEETPEASILRLENVVQGVGGNDQPIIVNNIDSSVIQVTGIGDGPDNRAEGRTPVDGDVLEIDNGLFETTLRFVDGPPQEPTDIEIAPTARGTRDNLLEVLRNLVEMDIPDLTQPTGQGFFLLGALAANPPAGDQYELVLPDGTTQIYTFINAAFEFDPDGLLTEVPLGGDIVATRANLIRQIQALNPDLFQGIPSYVELPAQGTLHIAGQPEDQEADNFPDILISDGGDPIRFRFLDEFGEDEDDPDFDFANEIIDARNPELIRIVVAGTAAANMDRLAAAIEISNLNLTVGFGADFEGRSSITLLNNLIGPFGNVAIELEAPFNRDLPSSDDEEENGDDEDENGENGENRENGEEEEELFQGFMGLVFYDGMDGGEQELPAAGETVAFFDFDPPILHPRMVFEFTADGQAAPGNIAVSMAFNGSATVGNLLATIRSLGLPLITIEGIMDNGPGIRIVNFLPRGGRELILRLETTADPDVIMLPPQVPGLINTPGDQASITLSDGVNSPVTFEFDLNGMVEEGNVPVMVSTNVADLLDAFIMAVREPIPEGSDVAVPLDLQATNVTLSHPDGMPTARLLNLRRGEIGNVDIGIEALPSGGVLVSGMEGGQPIPIEGETFVLDDGTNAQLTFEFVEDDQNPNLSQPGNVPVLLVEDDPEATRDNLLVAIKDSGLDFIATEEGETGIQLVHKIPGDNGNRPIQVPGDDMSFEVEGMEGGGELEDGIEQVYVHSRDANGSDLFDQEGIVGATRTELVSMSELGTAGLGRSLEPAISLDGRFVAFRTEAIDLQPRSVTRSDGEVFTNNAFASTQVGGGIGSLIFRDLERIENHTEPGLYSQVYVRDRESGENTRATNNRFGEFVRGVPGMTYVPSSRNPAINGNGRFVAFASDAENNGGLAHGRTNRNPLDFNGLRDVYIHDRLFDIQPPEVDPRNPITLELMNPPAGTSFPVNTLIPINVDASSRDGSITQVLFRVNGQILGETGAFPYSFDWQPSNPGTYTVTVQAIDSLGNTVVAERKVVITAGNTAPTARIISPGPETRVLVGNTIPVQVEVEDPDGDDTVVSVDVFVNNERIGTATVEDDGVPPFIVNWTPNQTGTYVLTATATDQNSFTSAPSDPVTIQIETFDPIGRDEDFVTKVYNDFLDRNPDIRELERDSADLEAGRISREDLISRMMDRVEFNEIYVNAYGAYRVILGRAPTNSEMRTAVAAIADFVFDDEIDDDELPAAVVVLNPARFFGLQSVVNSLLGTAELFNRLQGNPLTIQLNRFVDLHFDNIGLSADPIDYVRANTLINGGAGVVGFEEGVGRPNYSVLFIGDFRIDLSSQESLSVGVPSRLRERYRRAAAFFVLTGEVPSAEKLSRLASGSRRDAIREMLSSASYLNQFENFFGQLDELGAFEKESDWFGQFNDRHFDHGIQRGWIHHAEHGWLFHAGPSTSWLYDEIIRGWIWTNEGTYPFVYSDRHNTWLYYELGGTPQSRWFYFYNSGSWQEVTK